MVHRLILLFSLFVCLLTGCHSSDLTDSKGNALHLKDYQGKWLVINYWATWCKPCLTELPELNNLYISHRNRLIVLGVNFDQLPNQDIEQFNQSLHLEFPLISQFPAERWGIKDIPTLPATFIITPEGKSLPPLYGPQTQATLLKTMNDHGF